MKIGFLINDLATERANYTTTRLARAALAREHEAWFISVADLGQSTSGEIFAHATASDRGPGEDRGDFMDHVRSKEARSEKLCVDDLDVLFLRNDPAEDSNKRPWAVTSGILFGQLAAVRGVLVVNDPFTLANAVNKTYFQHFPEVVRPKTLISRQVDDIAEFLAELPEGAVLKPLQGSGGSGVFSVTTADAPNLTQIVEAISRDGYVVAQEFLPEAAEGDVRMFLMNGSPLCVDGHHAALRRRNETEDFRSNVSAGGKVEAVEITDQMLTVAERVRPKLLADGMFLVGLDIVGDKLMEINVFSPGGLGICQSLYDTDFTTAVIEALEDKVTTRSYYGQRITNAQLSSL